MVTTRIGPLLAASFIVASVAIDASLQDQSASSISGRVIDADSGRPIAGANVGVARGVAVQTGADGRYVLRPAPPGQVTVSVWGAGQYIATSLVAPRIVTVVAGRDLADVDFSVRLEADLSGRVIDERGQPVSGVLVTAVTRSHSRQGQYSSDPELATSLGYFREGRARTDDRGHYRFQLRAGRSYFIVAHPRRQYDRAMSQAPANPADRARALAMTYYPSAGALVSATPVVLSSFESREHVDIQMRRTPSYCLEATVTGSGVAAALPFAIEDEEIARLETTYASSALAARQSGTSGPDGRIRVCDLSPGSFRVTAAASFSPWETGVRGEAVVTIDRADGAGVAVAVRPPITVSGVIAVDAAGGEGALVPRVTVSPWPSLGGARSSVTTAPGEFSLQFAAFQRYGLQIRGLPSNMFVARVTMNGVDTLHQAFAAAADDPAPALRIDVADTAGAIAVTVRDAAGRAANGAVVIVLPERARTREEAAAGIRAAVTDETGGVLIGGLAPGVHVVLATEGQPPSTVAWPGGGLRIDKSPETLELLLQSRARGQRVEVRPRSQAAVAVRVVSIR